MISVIKVELEFGIDEVSNLDHNLHINILVCSLLAIYIKAIHNDSTELTDDGSLKTALAYSEVRECCIVRG